MVEYGHVFHSSLSVGQRKPLNGRKKNTAIFLDKNSLNGISFDVFALKNTGSCDSWL
jgi:hypothetical protein